MLQLAPGVVFARDYRIVKPLAEGGMGAVYVAEQLSTGKPRALKLMHAQLVADAKSRARFEQEARIGATLDSDHIVEVVGAGIDDDSGTPWLAMELLKGEDLGAVIERRGSMSPAEVAAVYEQLGHALGAAHAARIVHRDLKPENVFLAVARRRDVPFTVKLLDFGIAKVVQECRVSSTQAMGSPLWMAPEQTESGGVSPATDVWALGLMAFHLLTGEYYWRSARLQDGGAMMQLLREILVEPLPSVSVRAQESGVFARLPQGFEGWFHRCVVRDPAERFAEANAATQGLVSLLRAQAAAHPSWDPSLAHPSTLPGPLPATGLGPAPGFGPATAPGPQHAPTQPAPHHAPVTPVGPMLPYVPITPPTAISWPGPAAPSGPQYPFLAPPPAPVPARRGSRWLVGCLVAAVVLSLGSLTLAYYLVVGTDDEPAGPRRSGPSMTPIAQAPPPPHAPPQIPPQPQVPVAPTAPPPGVPTVTMTPLPPDNPALPQGQTGRYHVGIGFGTVVGDPRLIGPVNLRVRQSVSAFEQCLAAYSGGNTPLLVLTLQWQLAPTSGADPSAPAQVEARGPVPDGVLRCLEGVIAGARFAAPARLTQCSFPLTVTSLHAATDDE